MAVDPGRICELIEAAYGGKALNPKEMQNATVDLMGMMNKVGFASCLLQIWESDKYDDLRMQSLILLKNNCHKIWSQKNGKLTEMQAKEKEHCKTTLLNDYIKERNESVVKQVSQCICKIARLDWPYNWPNLFQILGKNLQSDNGLQVYHTMIVMNDLCEEFASMRLKHCQIAFAKAAQMLFGLIFELYKSSIKSMLSCFKQLFLSQNIDIKTLLSLTLLSKLCVSTMKILFERSTIVSFEKNTVGYEYIESIISILPTLKDEIYPKIASHKDASIMPLSKILESIEFIVESYLDTIFKCHRDYTLDFRHCLPNVLSFYFHIIKTYKERLLLQKEFFMKIVVVRVLLFYKDVLSKRNYQLKNLMNSGLKIGPKDENGKPKIEFDHSAANECASIAKLFFNQERVSKLLQYIIGELMLIDAKFIELRKEDPCLVYEQSHKEYSDSNIRGAACVLYKELMKQKRDMCPPIVMKMFIDVMKSGNPQLNKMIDINDKEFDRLRLKESVYKAFGEAYFEIGPQLTKNNINFSRDIGNLVTSDINFVNCPFIVDRVIWLVGQLKEEMNKTKELRDVAYKLLLSKLVRPPKQSMNNEIWNEYLIIRLNAAYSLGQIIDDRSFEYSEFETYFGQVCQSMLDLVNDLSLLLQDSEHALSSMSHTMQILHVVFRQCVSFLGKKIDVIDKMIEELSRLWESCNDNQSNLFRQSILACLYQLVKSMTDDTLTKFNSKLCQVLTIAVDTSKEDGNGVLLEYGFQLWHQIIYNKTKLTGELVTLFERFWPNAILTCMEYLDVLLKILIGYILLGQTEFVSKYKDFADTLLTVIINLEQIEMDWSLEDSKCDKKNNEDDEHNERLRQMQLLANSENDSKKNTMQDEQKSKDIWRTLTHVLTDIILSFPNDCQKLLFSCFENLIQQFINLVVILEANPQANNEAKFVTLTRLTQGSLYLENDNDDDIDNNDGKQVTIDINQFKPRFGKERLDCYLVIFSRLMVANETIFYQFLSQLEQQHGNNSLIKQFLQCMVQSLAHVEATYETRIVAFAFVLIVKMFLCKFLSFNNDSNNNDQKILFDMLCNIVPFWIENIHKNELFMLEDIADAREELNNEERKKQDEKDRETDWTENDRHYYLLSHEPTCGLYLIEQVMPVLQQCCTKLGSVSIEQVLMRIGQANGKYSENKIVQAWKKSVEQFTQFKRQKQLQSQANNLKN